MKESSLHPSRILACCLAVLLMLTSGCDLGTLAPAPSLPRNTWVSLGPEGGSVYDLVIDPSKPTTVYALAGSDIFRSTDGAQTWEALAGNPGALKLAIDPKRHSTFYAAGAGVFNSTDGGETWQKTYSISVDFIMMVLVVDTHASGTAYSGITRVIKSTDGGGTWTGPDQELGSYITALAVDSRKPGVLYAGTYEMGVLKSTDGGATWSPANTGMEQAYIRHLAIDPKNPAILYASSMDSIYKSIDAGMSWKAFPIGFNQTLGMDLGYESFLIMEVQIDPQNPDLLYIGTVDGVYKSLDGGESWKPYNAGIAGKSVLSLAIDPKRPSTLYAGLHGGGVVKSTNGGRDWTAANKGLTAAAVNSLAFDAHQPAGLYAGLQTGGVVKSRDGRTWESAGEGLPGRGVSALAADPLAPDTLYAGGSFSGVYKSSDAGKTWRAASSGMEAKTNVSCFSFDPGNPSILYAGTTSNVIYKSTDGGGKWEQFSSRQETNYLFSLVIDPQDPAIMYVGTPNGIFKTTDKGKSWRSANTGFNSGINICMDEGCTTVAEGGTITQILAMDPWNPEILFAGTYQGLYKSLNAGARWFLAGNGLPEGSISALAVDPHIPSTVFAGTSGNGVYRSTDGGQSWHEFNTNLASKGIHTLVVDPGHPGRLYAGTGGGVYVIDYGGPKSSLPISPMKPAESTSTRRPAQASGIELRFVTPQDGATLNYDELSFQVEPVPGSEGYAWTFIQNGRTIWDSLRDESRLYGAQYSIPVSGSLNGLLSPGDLQVQVKARLNGEWTGPASLTIHLPERQPTAAPPTPTSPPAKMNLRVNYGEDWVESFYESGHMAKITVFDRNGMTIKATAESIIEPKDLLGGEMGFQTRAEDWVPAQPDIQPNDWVYGLVDNGAFTEVRLGTITGTIDLAADSITGTVLAPWLTDPVQIQCLDWGSGREQPYNNKDVGSVMANGSDRYSCSWAGEWDIQPDQKVGVGYFDSEGNWVANWFSVTNPNQIPTSTPVPLPTNTLPALTPTATDILPTSGNLALGRPTTASHSEASRPSSNAVDGVYDNAWGSGDFPPQWIEIDLGAPASISRINLRTSQHPQGADTIHRILVRGETGASFEAYRFEQWTVSDTWLAFTPASPLEEVRWVRIETVKSPSWVAWAEIEIIGTR